MKLRTPIRVHRKGSYFPAWFLPLLAHLCHLLLSSARAIWPQSSVTCPCHRPKQHKKRQTSPSRQNGLHHRQPGGWVCRRDLVGRALLHVGVGPTRDSGAPAFRNGALVGACGGPCSTAFVPGTGPARRTGSGLHSETTGWGRREPVTIQGKTGARQFLGYVV